MITTQKILGNSFFRGANLNIQNMCAGSFYTTDIEIANDHALMEEEPCIYSFSNKGLNLVDIETLEGLPECDLGTQEIEDEILLKYDGFIFRNGIQIVLFGSFDCNTGIFTKSTIEEIRKSEQLNFRRYDR